MKVEKVCNAPGRVMGLFYYLGFIYATAGENIFKIPVTKESSGEKQEPGCFAWLGGAQFRGLCFLKGYFYTCDYINNRIMRCDVNTGSMEYVAGSQQGHRDGPLTTAMFCFPWKITADSDGFLYVTDDHHVRKIDLEKGIVETVAGDPANTWTRASPKGGYRDGPAISALFSSPSSLLHYGSSLLIADEVNHCIRIFKDGEISLYAGSRGLFASDGTFATASFDAIRDMCWDRHRNIVLTDQKQVRLVNIQNGTVSTLLNMEHTLYGITTHEDYVYFGTRTELYRMRLSYEEQATALEVGATAGNGATEGLTQLLAGEQVQAASMPQLPRNTDKEFGSVTVAMAMQLFLPFLTKLQHTFRNEKSDETLNFSIFEPQASVLSTSRSLIGKCMEIYLVLNPANPVKSTTEHDCFGEIGRYLLHEVTTRKLSEGLCYAVSKLINYTTDISSMHNGILKFAVMIDKLCYSVIPVLEREDGNYLLLWNDSLHSAVIPISITQVRLLQELAKSHNGVLDLVDACKRRLHEWNKTHLPISLIHSELAVFQEAHCTDSVEWNRRPFSEQLRRVMSRLKENMTRSHFPLGHEGMPTPN